MLTYSETENLESWNLLSLSSISMIDIDTIMQFLMNIDLNSYDFIRKSANLLEYKKILDQIS